MGPLISRQALERIRGYIDEGIASGAQLVVDGRRQAGTGAALTVPGPEHGFWLGAPLFDPVTPQMRIYQEGVFGPVLAAVRVPAPSPPVSLGNARPPGYRGPGVHA